jgi:hypothetical protein
MVCQGDMDCPVPQYDDDILQLQADCANVVEGRVSIDTFPEDYQEKIRNYYRFYGTRPCTKNHKPQSVTGDTLDLI